jgi:hypothetical protein
MEQPATTASTWDIPEFAAAAVLGAIAVLIAGATVAGIAVGASQIGLPPGTGETVGADMQYAAQWADIVIAIVLLALSALCWWQAEGWLETASARTPAADTRGALDHLRRVRAITIATEVELVLTGVGALAAFVGAILFYGGAPSGSDAWTRDILPAANFLAVVAVVTAGMLVARRVDAAGADRGDALLEG